MDDALLAEISAHPDDDAPRLVYADLLTSRGDPRGEFITLQCRLAATRDEEGRRKMRIAENKLFAAHGPAWTAPLRAFLKDVDPYATLEFERGFVPELRTRTEVLERLEGLFLVAPTLRRLRVTFMSDARVPDLDLRSPLFARLSMFGLTAAGWGDRAGAALRRCPLDGVRALQGECPLELPSPLLAALRGGSIRTSRRRPTSTTRTRRRTCAPGRCTCSGSTARG